MRLQAQERRTLLWLTLVALALRIWSPGLTSPGILDSLRLAAALEPDGLLGEQAAVIHVGSVGGVLLQRMMASISHSWHWLRLPYALAGAANVALLYLFARRHFDESAARVAGWLLCLAPFHLALSAGVEEHELTVLFALGGTWIAYVLMESPRRAFGLAPLLCVVEALGLFVGGYLILGYWLVLSGVTLAVVGRKFIAREWIALTLAQLPMLALFGWLLSYGVFDGGGGYTEWVRRMTLPILPTSPAAVIADLLVHMESWSWTVGRHAGVMVTETALAAGALALVCVGHRRFIRDGMPARPLLVLVVGVPVLMGAVYYFYFGKPWYFARAYASVSLPFYLLIASGLIAVGRCLRMALAVFYLSPALLSLAMMWTGFHPAHLAWEKKTLRAAGARATGGTPTWVHPGEFAALLRVGDTDARLDLRGLWRDPPLTPEGWSDVLVKMSPQDVETTVNEIAATRACLIELGWLDWRDPGCRVCRGLVRDHEYRRVANFWSASSLYCPEKLP